MFIIIYESSYTNECIRSFRKLKTIFLFITDHQNICRRLFLFKIKSILNKHAICNVQYDDKMKLGKTICITECFN